MSWCTCERTGTCLGCIIERSVEQQYGTIGVEHLKNCLGEIKRDKLLPWLNQRLEWKDQQIGRLQKEELADREALSEWGIYRKVIDEIEKGTFD